MHKIIIIIIIFIIIICVGVARNQQQRMSVFLRSWIGLVSVVSAGNGVMCFIKKDFPREKIYNNQRPEGEYAQCKCIVYVIPHKLYCNSSLATALAARLFGTWTLLSSIIRLTFAISPSTPGYVPSNSF